MIPRRTSLLRSLFKSLLFPIAFAGIVGVFVVYSLVRDEYDELQDLGLIRTAHLLLAAFDTVPDKSNIAIPLAFETEALEPDERTLFWFIDQTGKILAASPNADPQLLPLELDAGLRTAKEHRFAILRSTLDGSAFVVVATPMTERNEAIADVLKGVILGFLLLGLLAAAAAYLAIRRSSRVIVALSRNIAEKDAQNLSPIDRANSFAEIEPAIDTLDTLMARLDANLAAERAFATNAAHELRTPVAICLAQVQRLKSRLTDVAMTGNVVEIEQSLKRLVRLIERLLQMSRAQSGLGTTSEEADIRPVISLMLKEMRDREPSSDDLILHQPTGTWPSHIDPDALGIILGNLIENALKYRDGDAPTVVDASKKGIVVVSNDCEPLPLADIEMIQQRFVRKATFSDGFGLGLSIVQELCTQSGCQFEVISPQPGKKRGFTAVLTLP